MKPSNIKIPGTEAIQTLEYLRSQYPATGAYPYMIGDRKELGRIQENADFTENEATEIIQSSLTVSLFDWIAARQKAEEEYGFSADENFGAWPGEIFDKGLIGLHKDILSHEPKREVYIGLATIEEPWHLPAILKYGGWNDCPETEIHCAFHRKWQEEFGAEITGMSGDIVECIVARPPSSQDVAIRLAWEQYWYCTDIVDQGCGSVAHLAATLLHSPYWFFWWD